MAVVNLKPGDTSVSVSLRKKLSVVPPQIVKLPGGLYPLRASAWQMDEYRLMAGWPVAIPDHDIKVQTMCSATGEVLAAREQPTSVTTNAVLRWVADPAFYDSISCRWMPIQGGTPVWNTSPTYAPVLVSNYEYRVGSEVFSGMYALNFDSDTQNHMWTDFSSTFGGASGYTLILVMNPNSAYGNNVDVPYNGLWCPSDTPGTHWFSFTMQGNYIYSQTEATPRIQGVAIADQLGSSTPTYVALVVQRPSMTMYVGSGPSKLQIKKLPTGTDSVPLDGSVLLGRSSGDFTHTADMALFELGMYANALTPMEVKAEIAALSQVYGGNA